MNTKKRISAFLFGALVYSFSAVAGNAIGTLKEPPVLAPLVESGELPPMSERLPDQPLVLDFEKSGKSIGNYCCSMRMLLGKSKDIRMMTVYGYARLVGFNEKFELKPDILESFDVEEGRIFTLRLRKGHKWSDGHPFTAEDFRYYWEDVANDQELTGKGIPQILLSDGEPPVFEVIDDQTIRYTWNTPNPAFTLGLAGPSPAYIYQPSHYMKQFHKNYKTGQNGGGREVPQLVCDAYGQRAAIQTGKS